MATNFIIPNKMMAWVYGEHGDVANVLRLDPKFEIREVQEGQVPVKVHAAALNPIATMGQSERAGKAVKPGGSVVTIAENGKTLPPPAFFFETKSDRSTLEKVKPFLESGKVKPVVDPKGPFPFSQAIEALSYLQTGRATGKVVIHPVP